LIGGVQVEFFPALVVLWFLAAAMPVLIEL
jgi:hypothetical protein